jgi:DNA polymerase-3 subunit gamma/tau
MSLYNKIRPITLEQVKGNEEVKTSLTTILNKSNPPHTFLFHGPTGCGKTTIGRIVLNMLGCVSSDLREINSSDMRGIDTIRDISRNSGFKPIEGKARGWLIDEAHKMTNDAQNAFLKPTEDPPAHVFYVLCTTDFNKLIPTLRGRCQTYQLKPLSDNQMMRLLRETVKNENEVIDRAVYDQIIQDSLGHPRNAIQILEQVLSCPNEMRLSTARKTAEEQSQAIELCRALLNSNSWKQISTILNGLKDQEPEGIRRCVLGYCQAVLLKGDNERCGLILEEFMNPFYDSGFPQLVYACYSIIKN